MLHKPVDGEELRRTLATLLTGGVEQGSANSKDAT